MPRFFLVKSGYPVICLPQNISTFHKEKPMATRGTGTSTLTQLIGMKLQKKTRLFPQGISSTWQTDLFKWDPELLGNTCGPFTSLEMQISVPQWHRKYLHKSVDILQQKQVPQVVSSHRFPTCHPYLWGPPAQSPPHLSLWHTAREGSGASKWHPATSAVRAVL